MPKPGQPIVKADLDALAALANQVLLPSVNAALASGAWVTALSQCLARNPFDYFTDLNQNVPIQPQPPYAFGDGTIGANLVPPGAVYDGGGHYTLGVAAQSFYNWTAGKSETGAGSGVEIYAAAALVSVYYNNNYLNLGGERIASYAGTTAKLIGAAGQPVTARLQLSQQNWREELNRIRGDYWMLLFCSTGHVIGSTNYTPLNAGLYQNPDSVLSGPWIVAVNDPATFPRMTAVLLGANLPGNYSPAGLWAFTLPAPAEYIYWQPGGGNDLGIRIGNNQYAVAGRYPVPVGAAITLIGTASAAVVASLFIDCSGLLYGTREAWNYPTMAPTTPGGAFELFRAVQFYATDKVSVKSQMGDSLQPVVVSPDLTHAGENYTATVLVATTAAGQLTANVTLQVVLTVNYSAVDNAEHFPPAAPAPGALGLAANLGIATVTLASYVHNYDHSNNLGNWIATYAVTVPLATALAAGASPLLVTYTVPTAGWLDLASPVSYNGHGSSVGAATFAGMALVFHTANLWTPCNGVGQAGNAHYVSTPDITAPVFSIGNAAGLVYPTRCWKLDQSQTLGVWAAKTLPTPGLNVFLDNDLSPYVVSNSSNPTVQAMSPGIFNLLPDYVENPIPAFFPLRASSMRQMTLLDRGEKILSITIAGITYQVDTNEHKFNLINQSCQPQPSPWLVLRDTDSVPFDYGNNWASTEYISANQTTPPNGSLNYYDSYHPAAPWVSFYTIRLVAKGTAKKAWVNGKINYGDPAPAGLKIYVSFTGYPDPSDPTTYQLLVLGNVLTLPASMLALNQYFNYAVAGPVGPGLGYDVVEDYSVVPAPARQYFPACQEVFSANVDGTPWTNVAWTVSQGTQKMIPQSGYCIFKLRARRLPVANADGRTVTPASGADVVITVGQNKLQADGSLKFIPFFQANGVTPFTLTIPAAARDTGDVAVFWPVLSGNEIVYQAAAQVILEAWANWQPIFHAGTYSIGGLNTPAQNFGGNVATIAPTAFQPALGLVNWFPINLANYPDNNPGGGGWAATRFQLPMSVDVYNDLEASLVLLGTQIAGGDGL